MKQIVSKTTSFEYQKEILDRTWDKPFWGLLMDQGTGKTKIILDTAIKLYHTYKIDTVIVVCPNGVKTTWEKDEIPKHTNVTEKNVLVYDSKKSKEFFSSIVELYTDTGLLFLILNYEFFISIEHRNKLLKLLHLRTFMLVLDESTAIKTPGAKRTKSLIAFGKSAKYRRILTGTPVANSPFDIYSQMRFLDDRFWLNKNIRTYALFKKAFADIETVSLGSGRAFPKIVGYKNLGLLRDYVGSFSTRIMKIDILDLPEKTYTKRYFNLSPAQRKIYRELCNNALIELDSMNTITMTEVIVRLLRLQQVTCGYVGTDMGEIQLMPGPNPRIHCLLECIEESNEQIVIFYKFQQDGIQLSRSLGVENCSIFDGTLSSEEREMNRKRFLSGETRFFLSNYAVGSMGLNLVNSSTVIFYNSNFRAEQRIQAEDRVHRIGQKNSVLYIDIIAEGTVDEKIIQNLLQKEVISATITGDELREWING
jgi:Mesyanzhinovviridae DNA helicase